MRNLWLLTLLLAATTLHADCRTAELAARGALSVRSESSQFTVSDRDGIFRPRFSPDGASIAYHTRPDGGSVRVRIVDTANATRRIDMSAGTSVTHIAGLGWRSSDTIWIETGGSGSEPVYFELDSSSGAVRDELRGVAFSVSPDGTRVAHITASPRVLMVDGRPLGISGGSLHGPIVWSTGSDAVTVQETTDGGTSLVEVNMAGERVRTIGVAAQHVAVKARTEGVTFDRWCPRE